MLEEYFIVEINKFFGVKGGSFIKLIGAFEVFFQIVILPSPEFTTI
jgi:hypothetical protein